MAKHKRPQKPAPVQPQKVGPLPVVHGDCFRTFLDEARSIGNEVQARREFDADVAEYLQQKGLMDEWSKWREEKHAPKTQPAND